MIARFIGSLLEGKRMIALLIPALWFGWLVFSLTHAPEGYEDETGFHYGHKPGV